MRVAYEYSLIRVVPHVERGEFINAGVLLYCESRSVLRAAIELDEGRLVGLFPRVDVSLVRAHLEGFARLCPGGPESGPLGELSQRERWRWMTAPRSTILQPSPVHGGTTADLDDLVEHILVRMVRCPPAHPPDRKGPGRSP